MAVWQRPARVGLASFALTLAGALLYSMYDRDGPPAAATVAPADPEAVLESRGARITSGKRLGHRRGIGSSGMTTDRPGCCSVEVIVPAGEDGTGFRIRSGEATVVAGNGGSRG